MNPRHGEKYVVTKVGAKCPLRVGEHIVIGNRSWFDLFTGQVSSMEVVRESGERVKLICGPETGAYLEDIE